MNLYKQSLDKHGPVGEPLLLMQSNSLAVLRAEAERLARAEGNLDIAWLSGEDSSPPYKFPHELDVDESYRLVIRDW
mgnify:FL=1